MLHMGCGPRAICSSDPHAHIIASLGVQDAAAYVYHCGGDGSRLELLYDLGDEAIQGRPLPVELRHPSVKLRPPHQNLAPPGRECGSEWMASARAFRRVGRRARRSGWRSRSSRSSAGSWKSMRRTSAATGRKVAAAKGGRAPSRAAGHRNPRTSTSSVGVGKLAPKCSPMSKLVRS